MLKFYSARFKVVWCDGPGRDRAAGGKMAEIFALGGTLLMLIFLQAVLGFDNLLYISIESKRVAPDQQKRVRRIGIGLAILLRIVLLLVIVQAIQGLAWPLFELHWVGVVEAVQECHALPEGEEECHGGVTGHALIVLFGGAFILYTAVKEILHMLAVHDKSHEDSAPTRSAGTAIFWIVVMNLVFSFDSILGAIALTDNFWVMAIAIIISGVLMVLLADTVTEFLKKNRMYEILGLFILFLVGVMLVSEGGHLTALTVFGYPVEAMPKSTFYFVLVVLVLVDVAQSRYQKKLNLELKHAEEELAKH
jgi:predicted tellurium resistance membrane protein TerC